ncbi:MAG: SprB repeat-containing protein, partial [Bacteroidetes bacterium]|nr:SprB repeat-containing protein [Bacteroidota bacterium]
MKLSTLIEAMTFTFVLFLASPLSGQNQEKSGQLTGRKYPPEPPLQTYVLPGSNTDAPAGSISVAEDATYNAYTPQQLVQNLLVTGCLTASNVRFGYYTKSGSNWVWNDHTWSATPGDRQMAYFNKATSTFPLNDGIILCSGKASSAMGPNNTGSKSDQMVSAASDPDLASITGMTMHDASVLEFDFVPAGNTIEFTYMFSSEEYIEYCETNYNDAFGFFLSGPGITGTYTNNAVNLATIPGNIPVSINTIHPAGTNVNNTAFPAENAAYYLDNPSGSLTMQYDGSTVVLTATYSVTPCSTYRIRMAIADASDQKWDCGVFLGARSFNSENVSLNNWGNLIEDQNNIFEGCNNFFRVTRANSNITQPATVNLILSGTATNGVDIKTSSNQPFPTSVTIPANATYVDIPYSAVADGVADNGETFIIQVNTSCPCSATQVLVTSTIHIYEQVVISSVSATNALCNGQSNGTITVNATGGSGSYLYSINNGTSWQSINNFTGLAAGTYTVLVKDPGSCFPNVSATATIGNPTAIVANAGPDVTICSGGNTQLNGTGGVQYSWSPASGLNFTNIANPIASPTVTTTYTLTVTNATGACASTDQVVVNVNPSAVAPTSASVDRSVLCNDDNGNIILTATGGSGTTLKWYTGYCGGTLIGTGNNLSIASPTATTTYYAAWENSCGLSTCSQVTVNVPNAITASLASGTINCNGGTTTLTVTASGGTGTLQYSLNGGSYQAGNTFTVSAAGSPYTVTVIDANNCTYAAGPLTVTQPSAIIFGTSTITNVSCTGGNNGQIVVQTSGGTGTKTYSINPNTGSQSPSGTFTGLTAQSYTITGTDANGCTGTATVVVGTIADNTAPTIVTCAPSQSAFSNASCKAAVPNFTANVTATDNCTSAANLTITQSPAAGTLVGTGVTNITITVKDAANNAATCTTTFTVTDNTAPTIVTCAPAQSAFTNATCQAAVPNFTGNVTATDNCTTAASLTITQSPAAGTLVGTGVTNVTITVKDAANNSATCTTTFTVTDNTAPTVVTCAPAQSAFTNATCQAAVPNFTGNVTATDNCTSSANLTITQSPAAGTLVGTGVTNVTITVKDAANNSATCTTTFTVSDNTAPTIVTCAPAQSAFSNATCKAAIPDFTANVTATDNCTTAANLTITQAPTAGTLVGTGVTNITITVKDAANNSATCTSTFTVTDNTAPTIVTCAPAQSAYANGSCQSAVPDFTTHVTATDNCTASNALTITQSPTAGTLVGTGVTNVTITVKDAANNSATCTTTFTVTDNTAPTIVACAPAQTAYANASCHASVPNFTANVTATDNCTSAANLTITQSPAAGTLVGTGVTNVTITVKDAANNSATCTTTFTVTDNTAPTIVACAPAQTAYANASCHASVPNFTANVTATDNCTSAANLTITQSPAAGTLVGTGVTNVTITVKDAANNSATCTTTFTVTDNTNPTIVTCAPAQTAFANAACQAAVPDFTANVTATDNCTTAANLTITQSPATGTLVGTGVTNVTITVKDAANNSATCTTTFTVSDNTAPTVVTCAPTQTAFANAACQAAVPDFTAYVTATDNCTSASNLTFTQSPAAGTLVSTGVTNVTLTVKDAANNSATCTTTFTVTDNTAPTIVTCAPAQTAFANSSCQASVPNFTGNVTVTDNCTSAANLTITQSPAAGTLVGTGVTNVTITVKDAANNSATCTTTFTVSDNTAPTIVTCAPAQSAFSNATCKAAVPDFTAHVTATDNCTTAANLTITQSPAA